MKNQSELIGEGNIKYPLGFKDRAKYASNNPVAMALTYQHLIYNVLEILFGAQPNHSTIGSGRKVVRTGYYKIQMRYKGNKFRTKGIFGYVYAYFGTHEAQHRGTLHFHVILYGGISPEILDATAGISDLCCAVSKALDTMYSSEIPPSYHIARIFKNYRATHTDLNTDLKCLPMWIPSFIKEPSCNNASEWCNFTHSIIAKNGIHRHTFTCRKNQGRHCRCREAFKQRPTDQTKPVLLYEHPDKEFHKQESSPIATEKILPRKKQFIRPYNLQPLPVPEPDRCVYWDIKRNQLDLLPDLHQLDPLDAATTEKCLASVHKILLPSTGNHVKEKQIIWKWFTKQHREHIFDIYHNLREKLLTANQYVVQHNDTLSNTVKFNTNAVLLGSRFQSIAAMFYLTPYIAKGKVAVGTALQAMHTSLEHIEKFPSTAPNATTDERKTQHWLTQTLNTLSCQSELSDQQVAFSLLGNSTDICTETFTYLSPSEHVALIRQQINNQAPSLTQHTDADDEPFEQCDYSDIQGFSPLYITELDGSNSLQP